MKESKCILFANKKAIELVDSKKVEYLFTNYLCYVAIFVKALVTKDIKIDDDDLRAEMIKEVNRILDKNFKKDRESQLLSLLFALSNNTFDIENSLMRSALSDAIDAYEKYSSDLKIRKDYVINAANKDSHVLIAAAKAMMMQIEGDELLQRVHHQFSLTKKELKTLKKELSENFDDLLVVSVESLMQGAKDVDNCKIK